VLMDGAQLVEDLLGKHEASRARAEVASLAKAGAVALLAALVGGAGYMETRTRGADASSVPAAADEAAACEVSCADADVGLEAMASDFGEDLPDDDDGYDGFMDDMYEGAFDGLGADDLVAAGPAAEPAEASAPFSAVLDGDEEQAVASDCPDTGAPENVLAEYTRGSKVDPESEQPADVEEQQEEQLETALAQEYLEAMGDDYAEIMEHEYRGLLGKVAESGLLLDNTT